MTADKKNLQKIRTDELKVGMYVKDTGRSWLKSPWATRSKRIGSREDIDQLREYGITEVVIDLARSAKAESVLKEVKKPEPPARPSAPSINKVERRQKPRPEAKADPKGLEEELPLARKAYSQALGVTRDMLNDVRAGKKIEVERVQENVETLIDSVFRNRDALMAILKLKNYDEYTFTHSINVSVLTVSVARHMGVPREKLRTLGLGGLFHDVGKMGIDNEILNKPGRLTDEEFKVMQAHPSIGYDILKQLNKLSPLALDVVRHHHERLDGSGYPDGLSGEKIRPMVVISGMADVYDALSSDRVYHQGRPPHEALKIVFSLKGKHFRAEFVDRFIHCLGIYPPGTTVRLNTGEIGIVYAINHASLLTPRIRIVLDAKGSPVESEKIIDLGEESLTERKIVKVVDPVEAGLDLSTLLPGL